MKDGTLFGADDGGLWRVFAPPVWRLDLWCWFLLTGIEKARLVVDGRHVCVVRDPRRLPNVPLQKRTVRQ